MKEKIKYTDEPLGELRVIDDFLPPPEEFTFKEENIKITISLSKPSRVFQERSQKASYPVPENDPTVT